MLKQIKTLGLSLVIGSMLVTSIPTNVYGATKQMSEEDRVVEMYKYTCENIYGNEYSDKDEAMVRKYFKYRTIKELAKRDAKEWYDEKMYQSNTGYVGTGAAISVYEISNEQLEELFPNIGKMNIKQQAIIKFMYVYKFNRHLNLKNHLTTCKEYNCHNQFITDKYAEMFGVGNVCGEHHDAPISTLSGAGAKAAYSRVSNKSKQNKHEIKVKEENDEIIVLEDNYYHGMTMTNRTETITFDKETRAILSEESNY